MAGWIKVEKATATKPEIAILARKLGVSFGDAFLSWFRVYAWADGMTATGDVMGLALVDVDSVANSIPGTCEALASKEIGWMQEIVGGVRFLKWDRHNGKSAKARSLEAEAKRLRRSPNDEVSDSSRTKTCDSVGLDETRREEEKNLPERQDSERRDLSTRSPIDVSKQKGRNAEELFDLTDMTELDWGDVVAMAEAVAKRVPPRTASDRRAWLKYAVLAHRSFGQHWLLDSAEAVVQAKESKKNRQAHFVGVLQNQCAEKHGISAENLKAMCRRIDIPPVIWKSESLPVREVSHGK